MTSCPPFLFSLSRPTVTLDEAFAACATLLSDYPAPTNVCRQCFTAEWEQRIIEAAKDVRAGKTPEPHRFAQIYFEHPGCVGGEDTIKLFAAHGIRALLVEKTPEGFSKFDYFGVIEKLVQSGFWFWPEDQRLAVREIALCLFWDWFEAGRYDWPSPEYPSEDTLGQGDEILTLCSLCQIDPFDIVCVLSKMHTVQADAALAGPLNFSANECSYVARDTSSGQTVYQDATRQIGQTLAAREAAGFLAFVTEDWVDAAYFRNAERDPEVAKDLSDFGNYYDIRMVKLREAAQQPMLETWPQLDQIR